MIVNRTNKNQKSTYHVNNYTSNNKTAQILMIITVTITTIIAIVIAILVIRTVLINYNNNTKIHILTIILRITIT